jgi:hypothetical protein
MDRYWSYIATPLFFATIGFGIFTLFVTQDVQVVGTKQISNTVGMIRSAVSPAKVPHATPASVANPAKVKST